MNNHRWVSKLGYQAIAFSSLAIVITSLWKNDNKSVLPRPIFGRTKKTESQLAFQNGGGEVIDLKAGAGWRLLEQLLMAERRVCTGRLLSLPHTIWPHHHYGCSRKWLAVPSSKRGKKGDSALQCVFDYFACSAILYQLGFWKPFCRGSFTNIRVA